MKNACHTFFINRKCIIKSAFCPKQINKNLMTNMFLFNEKPDLNSFELKKILLERILEKKIGKNADDTIFKNRNLMVTNFFIKLMHELV